MKAISLIVLGLFAFTAQATNKTPPVPPPDPKAVASAEAVASSIANANASAVVGVDADSSASVGDIVFRDRLQAPASFSPSIAPTAPCYYSVAGGLSIPGGSIGGGKAIKDAECENRENIRLAYSMGLQAEADYLFCSTIGKDIPNCGKRPVVKPLPEPETKQPPVVVSIDGCGKERVLQKCPAR